ncbi:DUF1844 domain-containing protein [Vulgatibacter incomptus]|uniref:DUF1844 domain-containing protein n=1 Tax=Vulgatibacter incomptus TaxID=1391653 RepID=A0A0K1PEK0_9BACT|nr:DUF1844 domain-containing protein [Vulgatibacter incomptus]AKU91940.1 hypothetical protein AKJ08_2327 [Vulgatibacter incomptus]
MAEREEDKPFVVHDRRRFTETGETRPDADRETAPPPGAARTAHEAILGGPKGPNPEDEPVAAGEPREAAPIDFTTFVFSLGSSALMHLGEAPHPETGEPMKNLELAKETIDLLAMLQAKTKGNLTPEEGRFLGALLYDLRLRYVDAAKK